MVPKVTTEQGGRLGRDVVLIFMPTMVPDEEWIARTKTRYPGLQVRWYRDAVNFEKGKPSTINDLPPEVWDGVTILLSFSPPEATLMSKIRFVQITSAGADRWVPHEKYRDPNVMFSSASGVHGPPISEWVIGNWIMSQRRFLAFAENMKTGSWDRTKSQGIQDSAGLRMGILGYGAIGRQCARLGNAMGMEIYAFTRSEKSTPESRRDDSFTVRDTGDPDGVLPSKWFYGASKESINEFLAQGHDLLVISLPLTPSTAKIIGREQLEILSKRRTFIANIARGKHIDTDALIDALVTNKIRGAALDVTDPEPLPQDHALWSTPNVFITPHVSWATPFYWERCLKILEINLEKLNLGERPINLINKAENY